MKLNKILVKSTPLENVADVKAIENVSENVSERYVPIYSTELIEALAPEFEFQNGLKFRPGSNAHYIDFKGRDGEHLRIYNSYDRSMAIRVDMISEGVSIPLGIDRLIHLGKKAEHFKEDFTEAKKDIIEAVATGQEIDMFLKNTVAVAPITEKITKAVFKIGRTKEQEAKITEVNNYTDLLLEKGISLKVYLNKTINSFIKGEYTYISDGVKRNGTRRDSMLQKLQCENRVMTLLKEENIEVFL